MVYKLQHHIYIHQLCTSVNGVYNMLQHHTYTNSVPQLMVYKLQHHTCLTYNTLKLTGQWRQWGPLDGFVGDRSSGAGAVRPRTKRATALRPRLVTTGTGAATLVLTEVDVAALFGRQACEGHHIPTTAADTHCRARHL